MSGASEWSGNGAARVSRIVSWGLALRSVGERDGRERQRSRDERGELQHTLDEALVCGLRRTLACLNGRTRFRFTAIYRLDARLLRGVALHDRENPGLRVAPCSLAPTSHYVAAGILPPGCAEATQRESLAVVRLRGRDGRIAGLLAHSDPRPRLLTAPERGLLEDVAPSLARWLTEHPENDEL